MLKPKRSFARKLLIRLLVAWLVIIAIHLVLQHLNLNVYNEKNGFVFELSNRVDLDDEISLPTWFANILMFCIGVTAFFAAYLQRARAKRRLWSVIGVFGIVLSLDEAASTHEFALQSLHNVFYLDTAPEISRNAWWLVAPFILLVGLLLAWQTYKHLPRRTFILFFAGGLTFIFGAVLVDIVAAVTPTSLFIHQGVLVAIEEGFELWGSIVVLYAIVDYIERYYHPVVSSTKQYLKSARDKHE